MQGNVDIWCQGKGRVMSGVVRTVKDAESCGKGLIQAAGRVGQSREDAERQIEGLRRAAGGVVQGSGEVDHGLGESGRTAEASGRWGSIGQWKNGSRPGGVWAYG